MSYKPVGRPKCYSHKLSQAFLDRWMAGDSIRTICSERNMPASSTLFSWIASNEGAVNGVDGFSTRYARAREVKCLLILDEIEDLADDAFLHAHGKPGTGEAGAKVQAIKIKIDVLKWKLSKILPECSDKIRQEISGRDGGPIRKEMELTPESLIELERIRAIKSSIKPPEYKADANASA